MKNRDWNILVAGLAVTAPVAVVAHAEIYLSEDQAAKALFPGVKLKADWAQLTPDEVKTVEKASGESVRHPKVRVLWGPKDQALFIDEVLGKHEFITYAVALQGGKVKGLEIMEYRETFGQQVRGKEWRDQFTGKDKDAPLRVGKDIKNISGATLSSVHVTNGVRRVVETYEVLKLRQR
ncbi:MAG TPA: FMN-binding protein [bacterium]|nr:FMN-binding protein [bacterium]